MHKIKVYAKLILLGLVALVVIMFMASNREPVTIKFLSWKIWHAPLFAFIFAMAGLGVVVFLISRKIRKVIADVKQLRREEKERKALVKDVKKDLEQKANSD